MKKICFFSLFFLVFILGQNTKVNAENETIGDASMGEKFVSGKVNPGTPLDQKVLSDVEKRLVDIATEKAVEKGFSKEKISASIGYVGEDIFINITERTSKSPPVFGGRVLFKKNGDDYSMQDVGVWE